MSDVEAKNHAADAEAAGAVEEEAAKTGELSGAAEALRDSRDPALDNEADSPESDDGAEAPGKRPGKVAAVLAGLALIAVLGGGAAWASGTISGSDDPGSQPPAASQAGPSSKREAGFGVSAEAEGWSEEVAPFGFAVVSESGDVVEEGEVSPGEGVSIELEDGVYAVSITSIPTAADGKTTWSLPASQMVMVEDGVASPAEVAFTLLPVDPGDEAAVEAVTANLPEAEREAARQHLAAKREDPSSDKVSSTPVRPPAAPEGSSDAAGKPSRKWGVVKEAWDEKVLVSAAWDETVVVKPAWTENKLVKDAWTETINHPAEYKTEKVKVGVQYICNDCGYSTQDRDAIVDHGASNGHVTWSKPIYEERQVLVKDAWTETINHPAQYQTVQHPAQTKTVHHDAVYKTVHHDAVWGWI